MASRAYQSAIPSAGAAHATGAYNNSSPARRRDLAARPGQPFVETQANCGVSGQAPYVILRVNFTGGIAVDDIVLFEPVYQEPIACQEWQTWDAAHPAAEWWSVSDPNDFFTLAEYLAAHPDATLVDAADGGAACPANTGGMRVAAGEGVPWSNSVTFVNFVRVRFAGEKAKKVDF